jgi:glyoxylase-like metal-dependent hydrolase (beta-lactamase superfamily II)
MPASPSIVNVGYRSTNFWVLSAGRSRLLVDLGWYGMFGALEANLRRMDIPVREITHGFATHYHLDHAGAAEDLKRTGMRLIVTEEQVPWMGDIVKHLKPGEAFTPITADGNLVIRCDESRALLASLGFSGELVHTPGHSDDSVSLVLDSGEVFTGDLTHPDFVDDASAPIVRASWARLAALGATTVYPAHGSVRQV